jgi:hypothetical protein
VTNAQRPNQLTRWTVHVDGDLDDTLSAFVRPKDKNHPENGHTIVLDGKQGLYLIVK